MGISRPHVWWHEICKLRPWNAQKCLRPCALKLCQSQFCGTTMQLSSVRFLWFGILYDSLMLGILCIDGLYAKAIHHFSNDINPGVLSMFGWLDGLVWWGHSFPKLPANSSASEFNNSPTQNVSIPNSRKSLGVTGVLPSFGIFWLAAFSTWLQNAINIYSMWRDLSWRSCIPRLWACDPRTAASGFFQPVHPIRKGLVLGPLTLQNTMFETLDVV